MILLSYAPIRPESNHIDALFLRSGQAGPMSRPGSADLTWLLQRSVAGDEEARDRLWHELHEHLKGLARARLASEGTQPCQATELVHEAYIKLDSLRITPRDRGHFLALAARAMRQVLIDQARLRQREKRGSGHRALTLLTRDLADDSSAVIDVLDLERALVELEALDPRKGRAVELSYFGGLSDAEVAAELEVSTATIKRDLRTARAWLASSLG
jgi:RNA polymerase sigma factor (TIGR02999 family)